MRPLASEPNKADLIPDELVEAGKITPVIEGLSAERGSCRRTGALRVTPQRKDRDHPLGGTPP